MPSVSPVLPLCRVRECPDCGLFNSLPEQRAGYEMDCVRCGKNFRRMRHHPMTWTFACALTGLLFYWVTLSAPLLEVIMYGRSRWDQVSSGIDTLNSQGFTLLAVVVILTIILMPLLKLIGLLLVSGLLHLKKPPRWLPVVFREMKHLDPWTMAEIYLLGFLVAFTRLQAMTHIHLELAVPALIGLTLSLVSIDAMLDGEAIWDEMEQRGLVKHIEATGGRVIGCDLCYQANPPECENCLRCGGRLRHRKPDSIRRSWALAIAAFILYIPANVLPIMYITRLGHTESYTIMRGVQEFIKAGLWPLAALVFTASMVIPALKLILLSYMLIQTQRKSGQAISTRTRVYRFIDFIGRWSMIDIFMLSILVGLMQFGRLADIQSGDGATYFTAVVILSMLAILSFDPRLMWDVARRHNRRTPRKAAA